MKVSASVEANVAGVGHYGSYRVRVMHDGVVVASKLFPVGGYGEAAADKAYAEAKDYCRSHGAE